MVVIYPVSADNTGHATAAEPRYMFSLEAGQMSAAGTRSAPAAETEQTPPVETSQM